MERAQKRERQMHDGKIEKSNKSFPLHKTINAEAQDSVSTNKTYLLRIIKLDEGFPFSYELIYILKVSGSGYCFGK